MRIGQNPAKSIEQVAQPQRITIALVNHIPFTEGYYAQSLDVLKLCLESIRNNADLPFDLLVFDNASCEEVRRFLYQSREEGKIQYLILSDRNIGKSGAWNVIFNAAPGDIIAYSDNDVYFYPGWLSYLVSVLELSTDIGMVTGMPLLNPEIYFTSTLEWAADHPDVQLERGYLLPWDDYWRHAGTLGGSEAKARKFYEENDSFRISLQGRDFYLGAGHFQFVAPKNVLQQTLPLPSDRPMGQVRALDEAINKMGYLRLSTPDWWVQHLGNNLVGWQPIHTTDKRQTTISISAKTSKASFWKWKPVRSLLLRIYDTTFNLLYKS